MSRPPEQPLPTEPQIAELLAPYLECAAIPEGLTRRLSTYLELLVRWNARTNLTAIRDPREIVQRHFGESLFCGLHLAGRLPAAATLLDFGSGAGFPGLPIQMLLPELRATLAESQGKKAAFLQEVVRTLALPTEVLPRRVEEMLAARQFSAVTLRAVDQMPEAIETARMRVASGGWLAILAGEPTAHATCYPVPNSTKRWLILEQISEKL